MEDKGDGGGQGVWVSPRGWQIRQLFRGSVINSTITMIYTFILCTNKQENMSNYDTAYHTYILKWKKMNYSLFWEDSLKISKTFLKSPFWLINCTFGGVF